MEKRRSEKCGGSERFSSLHQPNYNSTLVQEALEHLASIDLIELCNEAKIECCRATRDLRSCGRSVQHVLNSCGHASLCAECSQRCDLCPICRVPIPNNGSKVRLRLYNECIEARLISKQKDDVLQGIEDGGKRLTADVQRLYLLFDVAMENNLVSLVCHYVTDVCMDESAVSSDPVLAFLLDEAVVKDWCKQTFRNITAGLQKIYNVGAEEMKAKLGSLLKFAMQLTGISNVLEVLQSSLKETLSSQLHDLHDLSENISKAQQHLEVMTWCVRHTFLENVQSRYPNYASWQSHVHERKSAAVNRSWPDFSSNSAESAAQAGPTLFIEDALSNLGIEQGYGEEMNKQLKVTCLKKDGDLSKNEGGASYYPFENLRAATDLLFLHGSSDLVVAKRAIFLYYLFDRHWTISETEWRHLVDDFAATFGISRHSLLESLTFYLLDDHTDQALQDACHLLPEIVRPETHPKIAQVLLERQIPDAALMVLRCSGRDGLCAYANSKHDGAQLVSIAEAVTAVRVRVECGLLTEAFMYQRTHCLKVKEEEQKPGSSWASSNNLKFGYSNWLKQMEALVTEICCLCIRRNLVDRMIELPWNSHEEKYLHKCLFDNAFHDRPTSGSPTTSGSLLVVFYLQRHRYIEAYQVDRDLQNLEQNIISKTLSEEVVSKIRLTSQWRAGLVEKCIELLPEVQRQQVKSGNLSDFDIFSAKEVEIPPKAGCSETQLPNPTGLLAPSSLSSSLVIRMDQTPLPSKTTSPSDPSTRSNGFVSNSRLDNSRLDFSNYRAPSILHGRLLNHIGVSSPRSRGNLASKHISSREASNQIQFDDVPISGSYPISSQSGTPLKELNRSALRLHQNNLPVNPPFLVEKVPRGMQTDELIENVENDNPPHMWRSITEDHNDLIRTPGNYDFFRSLSHDASPTVSGERVPMHRPQTTVSSDEPMDFSWSFGKREPVGTDMNANVVSRWRSDETSDEEEYKSPERVVGEAFSATPLRGVRRSRFHRR